MDGFANLSKGVTSVIVFAPVVNPPCCLTQLDLLSLFNKYLFYLYLVKLKYQVSGDIILKTYSHISLAF
jgi:hypothetical protein